MKINKILLIIIYSLFISCSSELKHNNKTCSHGPDYIGDTEFRPTANSRTFKHNGPVVCFDESHHNLAVERGFYKPMLYLLESDGYKIVYNKQTFTKKSLKRCQIVYISAVLSHADYQESKRQKGASAFSDLEVSELFKWVSAGGSLLVMTDHKPMGSAASKLLDQFGVVGSLEIIRSPKNLFSPFTDDGIFRISRPSMNLQSPIIKGRSDLENLQKINFYFGQALKGPPHSDIFLKTPEGSYIEQSHMNDFPAVALALNHKKGRLVVFGDATVFTSKIDLCTNEKTGLNREGSDNKQLALNVFHWLSGVTQ